jgi:glycosyltransferase involved in cell wall biosynthesis
MRILLINSEYPPIGGGAGNASAHLATELVALGQDVTVITARFGGLPRDFIENGVRILRIRSLRMRQDRSGVIEQGIFMLSGILNTLWLVRKWRPDIILAFFGVPSGAVAWIVKMLTGIPYLVSLRGGDVPGFRPYDFATYHRMIGPLLHRIWHRAGAVIANSQGLGALASQFDDQVAVQIIPNGVDVRLYQVSGGRDWGPPQMLFVGRLVYQKGLDILIQALGELKNHSWHLKLVGDGPHRPVLESLAEENGITEKITFMGWMDKADLYHEFNVANLFVLPSRHEGMPNVILEAMACGLPVVASNIAGNEELVLDGKTGILVPPEDPSALGAGLKTLMLDSDLRQKLGTASRVRVEKSYTWDQVARSYLSVLQEIVGA